MTLKVNSIDRGNYHRKKENDILTFKGISDIPHFYIIGLTDNFIYGLSSLKRLDERLNESLIEPNDYKKIKELSIRQSSVYSLHLF
jgi:hypothetical protein